MGATLRGALRRALIAIGVLPSRYALRVFEAALDRGLAFGRCRKFWLLLRITIEERLTRRRDAGLFLGASAVRR